MMCDRKDRTMEEIRDYLARIEPKIHHIYENSGDISRLYQIFDPFGYQSQTATASLQMPMPLQTQLQYVSAVHQMMRWGAVWEMLRAAEPKIEGLETLLEPNFTSILMESQGRDGKLSHDVLRPNIAGGATVSYADKEWLEQGSTIYFSTFHLMHPVLDQEYFMKRTLSSAVSGKVPQESAECALVFLTIALAHMASTGGASLEMDNQPPGLHYFNEARRRMGFFMEESTIEAVQVFVLAGLVPDAGYGVYEEHFYSQISMRKLALDIHRTLSTDLVGAEEYLRQCVCWPIIVPPMSHSKRLIHGLYFWSHNLMGILIILRLAITHPRLQAVCLSIGKKDKEEFKRPGAWNAQARQTIFLCVEWFKSLVDIDADARWCWSIIQGIYPELVLSPTNTRFLPEFYPTAMPSQEG
ncbi:hypothetical protein K4K54_004368 [Colletotrichum sp. SAR 10_86]|nr:hypothetical protein KHU50_004895 [Colletotrichum sp. SAR 10_65]KAI8177489.1 hypothetical protein K4K51_005460 [Colletotrichum sp. SAR 10_75]KAI8225725.1 hypothetical protein K4K54_004368 [Colletotrichum sp. SAR 10_86]